MAKGKVLLVDDNKDFLDVLSTRMEDKGLSVETAVSGPEAIKKTQEDSYDAIILDMVMPEMDGIETLERMLAKNPELQVILLTGHASLEKGIEAVKMGALDFLEKPADIKALMTKIQEAKAKKALIVEKRSAKRIHDILGTKGW
ncbi:MAG: response regulator [Thermodesulfobacteriota bacterium]